MRRGQDPALQGGGNGRFAREPRVPVHHCREACMPPLRMEEARTQTQNVIVRQTGTGRMHAAPTNRPETSGKRVRKAFAADRPACERGRGFRTGARMSLAGRKKGYCNREPLPCEKRKPSRATPAEPRGFQRGPRLGISGGFFGFLPQAKPTQSVGSAMAAPEPGP